MASQENAPVVVLVVDDEHLVRELIGPALEDAGFAVVFASNGGEALRKLEQGTDLIRAVVTDVDLGDKLTGWDVAKRARQLRPEMAMVYVTGGNADEWPARGVPESLLIAKPFAPAQIVTAVSQLLNAASPPA